MMETQTRGKGTIDCGLQGSMGTLDDMNPTRLSKRSQGCPLIVETMRIDEELMEIWLNEVCDIFTSKLVLAAPDLDKEFRVEANTSNYATVRAQLDVCARTCSNL